MVAYTALVSLLQILDCILHPADGGRRIFHNRAQLKSLHEKVSFLLDFVAKSSHCWKSKESELEILEIRMRDAAYDAKYIIESEIFNQRESISYRTLAHIPFVYLFTFLVVGKLYYVPFEKVIVRWVQAMIPIEGFVPISVQSLLPFSFQNVILVLINIIVLPGLIAILSVTAAWAGLVTHLAVLKGISLTARYWVYASQPENQDLCLVIARISFIISEATGIKDASGSGQNADSLSKLDLPGIGKSVVVGLYRDLNEINERLVGNSPSLEVVPIVGMGGIGKTTLARQAYDDPYIVHRFDIRAWVAVSQEYSLRSVMLGLLDSAKIHTEEILQNNKECEDDELGKKLGEHLYRNLVCRRYLIVMDDVWDTKIWDFAWRYFPKSSDGSRILLTTRLLEVASYATSGRPLQMQFLDDDDSWHLLREKVFRGEGCPSQLEAIGRTIAQNCRGLPLAIVVVGGLLYNEQRTVQDWTRISTSLNSILSDDDEQCLEILGLSYKHLPHRLKPCFLYVGGFPGNEEICATRLFNLWAAEGFLEVDKSKSLEEVAEEYLKDLVQRSLIMVGKWSCNGKIKTCKIHDLLRQVCWLNIQKENCLHFANWDGEVVGHRGAEDWLRLCTQFLTLDNDTYGSISFYLMAHSFICVVENVCDLSHIYLGFRLLRVLDIVPATLYEFPEEIFELIHLRYLGLTYGWPLSPSISRLWNLQTIIFHNGRYSSGLQIPAVIWSMPNLRHLHFTKGLLPNPSGWGLLWNSCVLENLRTLVGILNFRCRKGNLKMIPNLNKLIVSYDVPSSVDWSEYELESLVNLPQLETLKISVQYNQVYDDRWELIHVRPPKLAFPLKLKKLHLSGCRIPWESMRIVGALPSLEVLKLKHDACQGRIWEPVEGEFCELKILLIDESDLEHWRSNEAHFPHLQRLVLRRCTLMEGIPSAIGEIPTLETMELVGCHPSALASARQIQEEQLDLGNVDLKFILKE